MLKPSYLHYHSSYDCYVSTNRCRDDNAAVLEHLDSEKTAFLFSCDNLLAMMELTTSIKTKLSMVTMIAPRITDPRAKSTEIANCFRFVNEKTVVEDVLKARAQTLQGSVFRRTGSFGGAGGMGGRGGSLATTGRGMSGRGGIGGRGGLLSNRTPSFSRGLTGSAKTAPTAAVVDGKDSTAPAVETAPMSQSEKIPAKRSVSSVFGAISETNSFA